MNVLSLIRDLSIGAVVRGASFKHDVLARSAANPGVALIALGLIMMLMPFGAHAATVGDLSATMDDWSGTVKDIVDFVMTVAVLVGVMAIAYGCKLVIDKSNDRENVKNGHIVVAFAGGALMCMLWFVVQMMSATAGDGTIGDGWQ